VTRAAVQSDVARVAELYRHSGRYAAEIKPKTDRTRGRPRDLVLEINEGRRPASSGSPSSATMPPGLAPEGRDHDHRIRLVRFLKPAMSMSPTRGKPTAELIRRFYAKNGFADAR